MNVRSIGLNKIYIAPIGSWDNAAMPAKNIATAAPTTDWVNLGDVYESTGKLTDDDPEVVVHKSETSKKKIVCSSPGDCKMELSLMDPSLEELKRLFGGEIAYVSGNSGPQKWTRPRNFTAKAFAVICIPEDGDAMLCPCAAIVPKFEITYAKNGIMLVPMTIQLLGDVTFSPEYSATSDPLYHAS